MEPISIIDLQKQISDISKSRKRDAVIFIVAFAILLVLIFVLLKREIPSYDKQISELQSTIKVSDARDSIIVDALHKQEAEDSMRTGTILNELARKQQAIDNITKRYAQKRIDVANLPDSDQLRLLSDYLTTGH